jgi:hypothetical protein
LYFYTIAVQLLHLTYAYTLAYTSVDVLGKVTTLPTNSFPLVQNRDCTTQTTRDCATTRYHVIVHPLTSETRLCPCPKFTLSHGSKDPRTFSRTLRTNYACICRWVTPAVIGGARFRMETRMASRIGGFTWKGLIKDPQEY